jgi:capsular polysaccharide biosynthesis protein
MITGSMWMYSKTIVVEGKKFPRRLPINLFKENSSHFKLNLVYESPDLVIYYFNNINLLPDSTLFYGIFPIGLSFPYFRNRIRHHSIKGIFDIKVAWNSSAFKKTDIPYLVIHDQWTLNYYHWMTQALPRLLLALKTQTSFTLLLPKSHCAEFHVKSLKLLGVNNWINFEVDKIYYKVHNLIYPSHDIQIGDYHDDLINELSLALKKGSIAKREGNYLFIQRASKSGRQIINENEVLGAFLSRGFEVVNFENLSFEQQGIVAAEASILAGVHGAGLTNMLFMKRGSKILELTSVLNGEQYYYYTLSNALGHDYYYQECKPELEGKTIQETNFIVDIEQLNKTIELMIRKNNG